MDILVPNLKLFQEQRCLVADGPAHFPSAASALRIEPLIYGARNVLDNNHTFSSPAGAESCCRRSYTYTRLWFVVVCCAFSRVTPPCMILLYLLLRSLDDLVACTYS
jgi:hypothetical protein